MIESGSHAPNVDPDRFGLESHTALRYEIPDPALIGLVADYHALDSREFDGPRVEAFLLPSTPAIRFILASRPMSVELAGVCYDPLPTASFYGTTSRAFGMSTNGGVTIGVNLTPVGCARLFGSTALKYRDRIVPLEDLLSPESVAALVETLRASDQGKDVKAILDRFLLPLMKTPHRDEAQLIKLTQILLDPAVERIEEAARAAEIAPYTLRRLATRFFGFSPKLLLMRTRFLRSMIALKSAAGGCDYSAIDLAYCDTSHFLRHSKRFLGMTPQQFSRTGTNYLDAAIRARAIVTGEALAALSPAPTAKS